MLETKAGEPIGSLPDGHSQREDTTLADNAVRHFGIVKTGFRVAKVVNTFGCVANTAESLDEFRYKNTSQRCLAGGDTTGNVDEGRERSVDPAGLACLRYEDRWFHHRLGLCLPFRHVPHSRI